MTNVFCPMIELGAIIPRYCTCIFSDKKTSQGIQAQAVSCDDFITCVPLYIVRFCLLQIQSEIVCACNTDSACPFGSILLFTQNIHVEIGECVTCGMRSVCLHCEHYTGG